MSCLDGKNLNYLFVCEGKPVGSEVAHPPLPARANVMLSLWNDDTDYF